MIIDEETRHYHNRIVCRERNFESMAGKPVLLRCILPLLRGRFFRSGLSVHSPNGRARWRLKPRIPSLEKKTRWRRDGKTREGETVQVKWTSTGPRKLLVIPSGQDNADRTSPRPGLSPYSLRSSTSAQELDSLEWGCPWHSPVLDIRYCKDPQSYAFHVSEVRAANPAFDFDLELDTQGPI